MHNSVTIHNDVLSKHTENAVAAVHIWVVWEVSALEITHQETTFFFFFKSDENSKENKIKEFVLRGTMTLQIH